MSIQAMAWVIEHSMAVGSDRLVLMAIANHADALGNNAYPRVALLAVEARVSRRTVFRALDALVGLGELVREPGRGRSRSNSYCIPLEKGANLTPFGSEKVPTTTVKGAICDLKGATGGTQNRSNRKEPFSAHARTRGGAPTDPSGSAPTGVVINCSNCYQERAGCMCEHFHGHTNAH